jgi:hypothetical protein
VTFLQNHDVGPDNDFKYRFQGDTWMAAIAYNKAPMSHVNEFGGGMSFVRDHDNGQSYAVVGLATGWDQGFTVGGVRNGTYRDAVTGNVIQVNSGTISFTVRAHSAGVYVLDGPGKIGVDGPFLR